MFDGDAFHLAWGHVLAGEGRDLFAVACCYDFAFAERFVYAEEDFRVFVVADVLRDGVGYARAG